MEPIYVGLVSYALPAAILTALIGLLIDFGGWTYSKVYGKSNPMLDKIARYFEKLTWLFVSIMIPTIFVWVVSNYRFIR